MTPKEQAAMQQALEALEELFHSNSTKIAVEKYDMAHNALREALAEPDIEEMTLTQIAARHEQAEQEPVCECHRKTSAVISSEKDL